MGVRGGGDPLMVSEDETDDIFVISINRVALRTPFPSPAVVGHELFYLKTGCFRRFLRTSTCARVVADSHEFLF